jgi:hypothetical protein
VVDLAELEVAGAIWEAAKYDRKDRLLAYLRSNRPLTAIDRQCLADYMEGKLSPDLMIKPSRTSIVLLRKPAGVAACWC